MFVNLNGAVHHCKWIDNDLDTTFLFINSLGTDFRIWETVVAGLHDYGNILLYDKRGHGLSEVVATTHGLMGFAEDAEALLTHFQVKKCIVVGLSVGGMIAQILADRIPDRIAKLILCDTRHVIGNKEGWNSRIGEIREKGIASVSAGVMERWFSEKFRKNENEKAAGYRNMLERTTLEGYIQTCEAIRDADLTEIAQRITLPTLCVVGAEDQSTPPEAVKELADIIPNSRFEIIPNSGHIPCVDNPEALLTLIVNFIK